MNNEDYQKFCVGLERSDHDVVAGRLDNQALRVLHGAIGMSTESGEIHDALKKHLWYGKPLDKINLLEECGDVLWYVMIALDALGYTLDDAKNANIAKLQHRYNGEFSEEKAKNRDLIGERKILEDE